MAHPFWMGLNIDQRLFFKTQPLPYRFHILRQMPGGIVGHAGLRLTAPATVFVKKDNMVFSGLKWRRMIGLQPPPSLP